MKMLFSRESQFWPGIFRTYKEAGLGQMTEGGADTLLLWNPDFYNQFCALVFLQATAGIDLTQARYSVGVFASSLQASCQQTGQVLYNAAGKLAGFSSSYQDLWRFTLINYNAGSGCLEKAVRQAQTDGKPLNWPSVSARLESACQGVIPYVEEIAPLDPVEVEAGAVLPIESTAATTQAPTAAPTMRVTPTPAPSSTPTSEIPGYPPVRTSEPTLPVPYP